jgi:hypothetical protein
MCPSTELYFSLANLKAKVYLTQSHLFNLYHKTSHCFNSHGYHTFWEEYRANIVIYSVFSIKFAVGNMKLLSKKGKVISVLNYAIKHYAMKAYGGVEGIAPPFLTSAPDGGE